MGKHRKIPNIASLKTEAEHREALSMLLDGRKPPARARLIENYLAAIESDQQRARITQLAEQISSEMGQRGRPPRDDAPRTSSQRTIESRQAYRDEVERALIWLLARITRSEQQEWAALFPKVVERGIAGMPPSRDGAGEPMPEEGDHVPAAGPGIDHAAAEEPNSIEPQGGSSLRTVEPPSDDDIQAAVAGPGIGQGTAGEPMPEEGSQATVVEPESSQEEPVDSLPIDEAALAALEDELEEFENPSNHDWARVLKANHQVPTAGSGIDQGVAGKPTEPTAEEASREDGCVTPAGETECDQGVALEDGCMLPVNESDLIEVLDDELAEFKNDPNPI